MARPEPAGPAWAVPTSLALCAAGLLVSAYLTVEHLTDPGSLACPATQVVDCARVTTSAQSTLLGIPVAVLGVVYFAVLAVLCLPGRWRAADSRLTWLRLGIAGGGVAFVLYLVYAELFLINAICLWCTVVHVMTVALFGVLAAAAALDPRANR